MFFSLDIAAETESRLEGWCKLKELDELLAKNDEKEINLENIKKHFNKGCHVVEMNLAYLKMKTDFILYELELGINLLSDEERQLIELTYLKRHCVQAVLNEMYIDKSTYYRIRKRAINKMSEILRYYTF